MRANVKFYRKKGTIADAMLSILESNHPNSVPTKEIAWQLFGGEGLEERIKVHRTARTLRKWGYRVHGFNGVYKFCDKPEDMVVVFERNAKLARGVVASTGGIIKDIEELGDTDRAMKARRWFKETLIKLLQKL